MNKRKIISRTVCTALTVLLAAFILLNSSADGETSSGLSLAVTNLLNTVFDRLSIPLVLSEHFIRKAAHFTFYSLLGGLTTVTVSLWRSKPWRFGCVLMPIIICVCFASFDEWIQTLVPGRCGCISDVLLDTCGVTWAALAVSLIISHKTRKQ